MRNRKLKDVTWDSFPLENVIDIIKPKRTLLSYLQTIYIINYIRILIILFFTSSHWWLPFFILLTFLYSTKVWELEIRKGLPNILER